MSGGGSGGRAGVNSSKRALLRWTLVAWDWYPEAASGYQKTEGSTR